MKIVIDIPEEVYKASQILDVKYEDVIQIPLECISNGTPFPKCHGRLIDADNLREDFKASKKISFAERIDISCIVDHAPTIIEADTESENKDANCN